MIHTCWGHNLYRSLNWLANLFEMLFGNKTIKRLSELILLLRLNRSINSYNFSYIMVYIYIYI